MKVVLVGGWARERILDEGTAVEHDHQDIQRYAYAPGLLKAVVEHDPEASSRVSVEVRSFPIDLFQTCLGDDDVASILEAAPDVVGFTCRCWDVRAFLATAARIKQVRPSTRIVLGGPSVSFDASDVLARHPAVDVVVRGEGERTFLSLCRAGFGRLEGMAGIAFRDGGGAIREAAGAPAPVDLEEIPSPYLTGAYVPPLHRILVEHARGCRFQCGFCAIPRIRKRLGHRAASKLAEELRWSVDHGYTSIDISSSAVNHDTQQLRSICEVLATFDWGLGVQAYLQLEPLDDEQLGLLGQVRFDDLIVGIESVDDRVRRMCGKAPLDRTRLERQIASLCAMGQTMNLFNILGLPGDTLESFRATVDYLDGLSRRYAGAMGVSFAWHALLPGSGFWVRREELGIRTSKIGMDSVIATSECAWEDLRAMAQLVVERAQDNPALRTDNFTHLVAAGRIDAERLAAGEPPMVREGGAARGSEREPACAEPWRYAFLVRPWPRGEAREGWTLQGARAVERREDLAVLSFGYQDHGKQGVVEVYLSARDDEKPAYRRTDRLNIRYRWAGEGPPPGGLERLLRTVCALVLRNEGAMGSRAERGGGRDER